MLDRDVDHQRFLRYQKHEPTQPAKIAWRNGYQAGWRNGRDVGLQPGITDHVDPMRTLIALELLLTTCPEAQPLIDRLAGLIRANWDDTTTWGEVA